MSSTSPLFDRLQSLLPDGVSQELRSQIEALLSSQLEAMNVVTREQFDVQQRVLEKTRLKLEALEQRLSELE